MKPLPLPIRIAAGLVATAADKARELPKTVTGLPVTVVSQALQLSMRVQQNLTEMAIRGDNALAMLRPVEETPAWATFDEDQTGSYEAGTPSSRGWSAWDAAAEHDEDDAGEQDPWKREEQAITAAHLDGDYDSRNDAAPEESAEQTDDRATDDRPAAFPDYPDLSIAQLRARLRTFSTDQLTELLAYERAHGDRDEFATMLSRRIDTVRNRG